MAILDKVTDKVTDKVSDKDDPKMSKLQGQAGCLSYGSFVLRTGLFRLLFADQCRILYTTPSNGPPPRRVSLTDSIHPFP